MPRAIPLRDDYSADDLRRIARGTHNANQARRLLALAAIIEGKSRTEAAAIGATQAQTLRHWVIAFNAKGPESLIDTPSPGRPPKLSPEQRQRLVDIVNAGPDPEVDGVARWRCGDLQAIIRDRFDVCLSESSIDRILKELGFAHISSRSQNTRQGTGKTQNSREKSGWIRQ
jgi:transposase